MFPIGTTIHHAKGKAHKGGGIHLLAAQHKELQPDQVAHCACYDATLCQLAEGKRLWGCHATLDESPSIYLVPLCPAHSSRKAGGAVLEATRAFPARMVQVDPALVARVRANVQSLAADLHKLKDLGDDCHEEVGELEALLSDLKMEDAQEEEEAAHTHG